MKDNEFIDILKQHADGFEINPPAGMFDKINAANITANENSSSFDFASKIKAHANEFVVAPSADLFDKINKARLNQNEKEFKGIIKKHSSSFNISPSSGLFEKIIAYRQQFIIKRYVLFGIVALFILSASSFFYWLSHSTDAFKNEKVITYQNQVENTPQKTENKQLNAGDYNSKKEPSTKKIITKEKLVIVDYSKSSNSTLTANKNRAQEQKNTHVLTTPNLVNNNTTDNTVNIKPSLIKKEKNPSIVSDNKTTLSGSYINDIKPENNNSIASNNIVAPQNTIPPIELPKNNDEKAIAKEQSENEKSTDEKSEDAKINRIPATNSITPPLPGKAANKNEKTTKWSIGIFGTPQFLTNEYHTNRTKENWANEYLKTKEENDKSRFNYQAGVMLERKLNNTFSVLVGLGISEIRFRELHVATTITPSVVVDNDVTISEKIFTHKTSYDVTMIYYELPLMLQYTKHWRKFNMNVQAGIVYNNLTEANAIVYDSDTMTSLIVHGPRNKNLQRDVFYFSTAVVAEYFPLKHISLYIGPTYRTGLNSLYNSNYVLSQKPTFYGLTMGVKYSF